MALQTGGTIGINDIKGELKSSANSIRTLFSQANPEQILSGDTLVPDIFAEFYGYPAFGSFAGPFNLWVSHFDGTLSISNNDGNDWNRINPRNDSNLANPMKIGFTRMFFLNNGFTGWALSSGEVSAGKTNQPVIYKTLNGGLTWTDLNIQIAGVNPMWDIAFAPDYNGVGLAINQPRSVKYDSAAGNIDLGIGGYEMWRTIDSGNTWSKVPKLTHSDSSDFDAEVIGWRTATEVWIGGQRLTSGGARNGFGFWKSIDGGVLWTEQNSLLVGALDSNNDSLRGLGFPTELVGYANIHDDDLWKTTDGGVTWAAVPNDFVEYGLFFKNKTAIYAHDEKSLDGGNSNSSTNNPAGTGNFFQVNKERLYAITNIENLPAIVYETVNSGTTYTQVTNLPDRNDPNSEIKSLFAINVGEPQGKIGTGRLYNNTTFSTNYTGAQLPLQGTSTFWDISVGSDGFVYQGLNNSTDGGIWRLNTATNIAELVSDTGGSIITDGNNPSNFVRRVINKDGVTWAAQVGDGWRLSGGTGTTFNNATSHLGDKLGNNNVGLFIETNTNIWISSQSAGLWNFNQTTNTGKIYNTVTGVAGGENLGSNNVEDVYVDSTHVWAICIDNTSPINSGLWRYNKNSGIGNMFRPDPFGSVLITSENIPSDQYTGIAADNNNIWVSSLTNLWRLNKSSLSGTTFNNSGGLNIGPNIPTTNSITYVTTSTNYVYVVCNNPSSIWRMNINTLASQVLDIHSSVFGDEVPVGTYESIDIDEVNNALWLQTKNSIYRLDSVTLSFI